MKVIISTKKFSLAAKQISDATGLKYYEANIKTYQSGERQCFIEENFDLTHPAIYIYHKLWPDFEKNILDLCMILVALEKYDNISLVTPFLPLLRQDREFSKNSSIGSKVLANILNSYNIKEIITLETHSEASQKFFNSNIINLNCFDSFYNAIKEEISRSKWKIISPDLGGINRAKELAEICITNYGHLKKQRSREEKITHSFDDYDRNTNYIILDDMIDSGGTIISGANLLKNPDNKIIILSTHIFSASTVTRIKNECMIHKIICSNTITTDGIEFVDHLEEIIKYINKHR